MSQQPTYLLAPNFRFKPKTGPIAIGNLIADPLRPHRALSTVDEATLNANYPRIETFVDQEVDLTRKTSHDVSMAIWAQFLQSISAKLSADRGTSVQSNYTMDALETSYLVTDPTLEEIEARIKVPRVQAVIKSGRTPGLRSPVYMVTGVIVAKGFAANQQHTKHKVNEIELIGDAPTPVGDVGLGAKVSNSEDKEEGKKWKASEDIVFAYQLLKIEVKGWINKKVEYDEFRHKAAYLGKDSDDDEDEEEESTEPEAVGVDRVEDLSEGNVIEVGEGDTKVRCISTVIGSNV